MADGETAMSCVHHFMLEPPHGPISQGVCKFCGFKKDHQNRLDEPSWMNTRNIIRQQKQHEGGRHGKD